MDFVWRDCQLSLVDLAHNILFHLRHYGYNLIKLVELSIVVDLQAYYDFACWSHINVF